MKRSIRIIVLAGVTAAVAAPVAQAGSTWSPVKPFDAVRPSDATRHAPSDAVRRVRATGFSDGRLRPFGLPWGG